MSAIVAVGLMLLVTDNPAFAANADLLAQRDTFLAAFKFLQLLIRVQC